MTDEKADCTLSNMDTVDRKNKDVPVDREKEARDAADEIIRVITKIGDEADASSA